MSKLTYEDKINLYVVRKNGLTIPSLVSKYNVRHEIVEYLIRLIDKHGFDILKKTSNRKYNAYEKERIINRVLLNNESIMSVSINEGLPSDGMLCNWILKYKENGYNIVERMKGRSTMLKTPSKKEKNLIEKDKEKIKRLDAIITDSNGIDFFRKGRKYHDHFNKSSQDNRRK